MQALAELRIALADDFMASGVKALGFVAGSAKLGSGHALLVLGGQRLEEPDLLHLLPLEPPSAEVRTPFAWEECFPEVDQVSMVAPLWPVSPAKRHAGPVHGSLGLAGAW